MSKEHSKLMRKVRGRLKKYVGMEMTHCGHELDVHLAVQEREDFLEWIGQELLAARKAGRDEVMQ